MAAGRRFLGAFLAAAAAAAVSIAAALVLFDPYDSGRVTPFVRAGVPDTGPRMANASRSRDPAFNAAVIGNSTLQLLSPERLKAASGLDFVQLTVPGTGPKEQLAMAEHLFARRGDGLRLLVLGLDLTWCDASLEERTTHPFPFWLYGRSHWTYLTSLFQMNSLEFLPRRLKLMLGRERQARRDGYWDYEAGRGYHSFIGQEFQPLQLTPSGKRPAADVALARALAAAPKKTRILLLHPPVFAPPGKSPGEAHVRTLAACKAALAAAASARPGAEVLDFWIDDDAARTRELFFDMVHFRHPMAHRIEQAIAARFNARD